MARFQKFSGLGLLGILALAGCRQDMHDQPRFKPLAKSDFYADLRSARPPVEGTVARGQLHEDTYFYTGKMGENPGDYMPFPVTQEVLQRGRERFDMLKGDLAYKYRFGASPRPIGSLVLSRSS